ncbi:MAG: bifunctional methylenetetrahydrofolate dehydrogenase/methenyltetrahydrofolate cyclohydrolase FolD [Vampirovibrio sp.]|nr:bifunctional methylenetetrahydrofolate dehydrogenase/methenyltetrahydrofolate cyclohydrolase FolD [Vampirovibrio sp.]
MVKPSVILDGKQTSQVLLADLKQEIQVLPEQHRPKLVVVIVGEDPASQVYVKRKAKVAQELGMHSEVRWLDATTPQVDLEREILDLNKDVSVHGILVQLPLPKHMNTLDILSVISPEKDVDGFHPVNQGRLLSGDLPPALPCTPAGVMHMLHAYQIPIAGQHAVVVGRSNIVGKPVGLLLLQENATVTVCHSRTQDLAAVCRQADILVAAVGIPRLIGADHVKEGAAVIDVGINRVDGKLVGDVDFEAVKEKVGYITPVPGGVGPMTIALLMRNTLSLYKAAGQ